MNTESGTTATRNGRDANAVQISSNRLTFTTANGAEHHSVVNEANLTCNGKPGKSADLKKGSTIRMTICQADNYKLLATDRDQQLYEATKPLAISAPRSLTAFNHDRTL